MLQKRLQLFFYCLWINARVFWLFLLYFVYFSVPCRQYLYPPVWKNAFPFHFLADNFRGQLHLLPALQRGQLSQLFLFYFLWCFFQLFIFYSYRQSFWDWICFSFSGRPSSLSQCVFSRQGPRWRGRTSKACVMTLLWKGCAQMNSGQVVIARPLLNCFYEIGFAP